MLTCHAMLDRGSRMITRPLCTQRGQRSDAGCTTPAKASAPSGAPRGAQDSGARRLRSNCSRSFAKVLDATANFNPTFGREHHANPFRGIVASCAGRQVVAARGATAVNAPAMCKRCAPLSCTHRRLHVAHLHGLLLAQTSRICYLISPLMEYAAHC